ncbi:MAG: M50 family metallopeptidase [Myxococcota bacterium]
MWSVPLFSEVYMGIALAILGLTILVIVHESGHYLVARALGMRVLRYSIGIGPTIFRYRPKGSSTVFQLAAIPFLAYVQIAGMNPQEEFDPEDPEVFPNKSVFARIAVIAAGPAANYLFASLVCFGMVLYADPGWPIEPVTPVQVGAVMDSTPAEEAGLQPGDVIVRANGETVRDFMHLIEITEPRAGQPTEYVVKRGGALVPPILITPAERGDEERSVGRIGVEPLRGATYSGWSGAAEAALVLPMQLTALQLEGMANMVQSANTSGLVGPVGMVKLTAKQAEQGADRLVNVLMVLSVALGLFNLLPIPALDGGRLMFLAYEVVTRKPPNERFEATVHTIGILVLLCVIALVTFRELG